MLEIKHFDHISMAAQSWREQQDRIERLVGFRFLREFTAGPTTPFNGCVAVMAGTDVQWEVLEPNGPDSFVQRFLDQRGPGFHHLAVEVPDIEAAAAELERLGVTPFSGITQDRSWRMTYIHPKEGAGVLWQIFEPFRWSNPDPVEPVEGLAGVRRVDHVSLAAEDLDRQAEWHARVFGMEEERRWELPEQGYRGCLMRIPTTEMRFEILAPLGERGFLQDFLAKRGQGLHHVSCEVASVDGAVERLRAEGIEPPGGVIDRSWKRNCFIGPRDSGGVLFQLFEEEG